MEVRNKRLKERAPGDQIRRDPEKLEDLKTYVKTLRNGLVIAASNF